jgi:methionyl-tRNA formyltransferase
VVFFGTPAFAVPTLDALLASAHPVVAVVTQPDRPRGRGQKVVDGAVKARAVAAGIAVLQPPSLKAPDFIAQLTALRADLGVVAAYGKILTETVLQIPRLGMINVHASLLPSYRGAAPIHRAVAAGEAETGVTIMRVVKALDAGAMIATVRRPIGPDDTSEIVEHDLARLGAALLVDVVDRMAHGPVVETAQDDSRATYAHRLMKEDGLIDWSQPAQRIHNLIRGMRPWPNAYSYVDGKRLILLRSATDETAVAAEPGAIVAARPNELRVATGRGTLVIHELQVEGKRPMQVRDFLAGHRLAAGDRFTATP